MSDTLPSEKTLKYLVNNLVITKKKEQYVIKTWVERQGYMERPRLFTEIYDVLFIPKDMNMENEMIRWFESIYNENCFIFGKKKYAFSNEKIKHMFQYEIIPGEVKESMGSYYTTPCKFLMSIDWMVI
jgi:hypothetical protein